MTKPDADRNESDGDVRERGHRGHRQRPHVEASVWIDGQQLQLHRRLQALLRVAKEADCRDDHGCAHAGCTNGSELEDACVGVSPLQFDVPQGATGGNVRYRYKPDFTAHFNKQKKYHEEQRREGKAFGKEDGDDMQSKWYYFEDVADVLCAQCNAEGAQSTADHQYFADTCINWHANGLIKQNTMYKGADRPNIMKILFAERSLVLGDINELENIFDGGMETFVQHLIVNLFNKKFAKELSQIGGVTLDKDSFADYFRSSNGKQLWVDKLSYVVTHSDGTKEKKTKFRVWRDYGNAVYASWMRWFMGPEQAYRVFSTDNEEKLGDGLETVLGFFVVISYFGKELPKWGNVCQDRPMLEATFLKFVRENMTTHMTGLNRKRSGTVKYMGRPSGTSCTDWSTRTRSSISRKPVHQAKRGKQASPMRTRLIVAVTPITPRSLKPNNRESGTLPQDEQNCCGCLRIFAIALAN